jgi:DNA-directed RNA polymerase subunit RPC12/RpoP
MEKYNKGDVIILEKVYIKLRPWIPSHPNLNVYHQDDTYKCVSCASTNIVEDKFFYTNRNKFKTFRCKDCGALSRETKGQLKNKLLVPIPR